MRSLRPSALDEFHGQEQAVGVLKVLLTSAKKRGAAMSHVLIHGGPGLGKTTLAKIVANEMGGRLFETIGANLKSPSDMAALLLGVQPNDVVFLDEVHAVPRPAEEILYGALEGGVLAVEDNGYGKMMKGLGVAPKTLSSKTGKVLPPFTVLAATTMLGSVTAPLRSRFAAVIGLLPYSRTQLEHIARHAAKGIGLSLSPSVARMVATRAKGTARIAVSLVSWLRDYATANDMKLDESSAEAAFHLKGVDANGMTQTDLAYLARLVSTEDAMGLETLAATLGESPETIECGIEPYMIGQGFVERTGRGRLATEKARRVYVPKELA